MSEHAETAEPTSGRLGALFRQTELIVVILLGLVSVATAYTGFQATVYDGKTATATAEGESSRTQAESLYLEGNQQYVQDAQTLSRLTELQIDAKSADATVAADAQAKYEQIYFIDVSPAFDTAIKAAQVKNDADPSTYTSPLDDQTYQASLFGAYADENDKATAFAETRDTLRNYSDRLSLNTALMAITLFLLGIAAVVRKPGMQWILIAFGMAIFALTSVLDAIIPFVWLD